MTTPLILVIEDSPTEQQVISMLLSKFDYDTLAFSSAEEALTALGVAKYAAILMDLVLPGIDGFECATRIRRIELESGRRTPIIAISASTDSDIQERCSAAGIDDHMHKPFDPEELRKMLLRYVYVPNQPNLKTLRPLPPDDLDLDLEATIPPVVEQARRQESDENAS
jgi:two-component system, sensor histidine kinase and response regulator